MNWNELIEVAGQLATQAVSKYGPVAWETTLLVVRANALSNMLAYFALLVPTIIVYKLYWKRWEEWADNCRDTLGANLVRYIVAALVCIGFTVGAVENLGFWDWVQLFYPELYLAHEAIEKVL